MYLLLSLSIEYPPEADILWMYVFVMFLISKLSLGLMTGTPKYVLSLVHAALRSLLLILLILQVCRCCGITILRLVLLQIESLSQAISIGSV